MPLPLHLVTALIHRELQSEIHVQLSCLTLDRKGECLIAWPHVDPLWCPSHFNARCQAACWPPANRRDAFGLAG